MYRIAFVEDFMLIHLKIFACVQNTHSISFYLLLCDVTYNHGKTVP